MTVKRIYPGSTIILQTVVKRSGIASDADDITFNYRIDRGKKRTITPVKTAPGTYTATVTLPDDEHGLMRYRWDTADNIDYAEEGVLLIEPTAFASNSTRDYSR